MFLWKVLLAWASLVSISIFTCLSLWMTLRAAARTQRSTHFYWPLLLLQILAGVLTLGVPLKELFPWSCTWTRPSQTFAASLFMCPLFAMVLRVLFVLQTESLKQVVASSRTTSEQLSRFRFLKVRHSNGVTALVTAVSLGVPLTVILLDPNMQDCGTSVWVRVFFTVFYLAVSAAICGLLFITRSMFPLVSGCFFVKQLILVWIFACLTLFTPATVFDRNYGWCALALAHQLWFVIFPGLRRHTPGWATTLSHIASTSRSTRLTHSVRSSRNSSRTSGGIVSNSGKHAPAFAGVAPTASTTQAEQLVEPRSSRIANNRRRLKRSQFEDVISTPAGFAAVLAELETCFCSENILFFGIVNDFHKEPSFAAMMLIFDRFIAPDSVLMVNIAGQTQTEVSDKVQLLQENGKAPPIELFDEAQHTVVGLMHANLRASFCFPAEATTQAEEARRRRLDGGSTAFPAGRQRSVHWLQDEHTGCSPPAEPHQPTCVGEEASEGSGQHHLLAEQTSQTTLGSEVPSVQTSITPNATPTHSTTPADLPTASSFVSSPPASSRNPFSRLSSRLARLILRTNASRAGLSQHLLPSNASINS